MPMSASSAMLLSMCSWITAGAFRLRATLQRIHRHDPAGDVAEPGHQAEQGIETEAPLRAGHGKGLVEHHGDRSQTLEPAPSALLAPVICGACIHGATSYPTQASPRLPFPAPG